ncbi:MAG: AMP-binding protein [Myxococcota bacterium]
MGAAGQNGALTKNGAPPPSLSPLEALANQNILITGTTGFLAKVMLAMLIERFSIGKLYCLVRAQKSKSARERFFDEVVGSEMMEPIQKRFGPSFRAYLDEKVEVLTGDISQPQLGLDDATAQRVQADVDVILNSAGLVNFNPPLDDALEVNTYGAREVADFALKTRGKKLVHISTCFVAGNRSGWIREDAPIVGYFPKREEMPDATFDWTREVKDLAREVQEVKGKTDDAALEASFKREAMDRLKDEGRQVTDRTLRAAITNQRRRWMAEELIRRGISRANHWGWPNIYTYTKALGEQVIASKESEGLEWCIVRPAIVESSLEYPFPGWNEGMNTSAPLVYLGIRGHHIYPSKPDLILDVVPVDYVASATLAAAAALLKGEHSKVYQVAVGDVNPMTMDRTVTNVGLYRRRKLLKDEETGKTPSWRTSLALRQTPMPMPLERYQRLSAPALKKLTGKAREILDNMEPERYGPLGGLISQARRIAKDAESDLGKVVDIFELFLPFIWENEYLFRTKQTRGLFSRMNEADRRLLPYWPEKIDWRLYWLDVHIPGLEQWVFPKLEDTGRKRVAIPRAHRDLAELFESQTEEHARRVAFRMLKKDDVADSFSYRDVRRAAQAAADFLLAQGLRPGDRVVLGSESRPEWGMAYFGIILAGGTAVPIDVEMSAPEIANILRSATPKGIIGSEKLRKTLADTETAAPVWGFETLFSRAHEVDGLLPARPKRSAEDIASIIFTSGTTGVPKGVMLSDRNFVALTARLSALFDLSRSDSLLSVLPLHHTFEFSAGFLMPFASGSSVTYLEERTSELMSRALQETPVTGLIGVPAVWESLHRKLIRELSDRGRVVEWAVRQLMKGNRLLRDHSPWNLGKWVFRPMHEALGGRVRMMVSGGAALSPSIYKDLRGLGFSVYEGYGLTEASPVISVGWPRDKTPVGSVGWPIPGVEVKINDKNDLGVGEVLARGPTIMAGYLDDPESTKATIRDGWLHTGDLGRLDDDGHLYIVGRSKELIIDTSGKNVYPDEVEELYSRSPLIKEISVVGIPAETGTGERVAALVVPDYEAQIAVDEGLTAEQVRERIREHFRDVGSKQPFARRVRIMHFWEKELPRTSTRKIKRGFVRDQVLRLERTLKAGRGSWDAGPKDDASRKLSWVRRTIASIAQRPADEVRGDARLVDGLGFDSLMSLELMSALEAEFPNAKITQEEMATVETVDDVLRLATRDRSAEPEHAEEVGEREEARPFHVPSPVASFGKAVLGFAQRATYGAMFDVKVEGQGNIPANANFIVAANHTSHLDMGLAKTALKGLGGDLVTLAAKDYFFDDPVRRIYFENFTNLLPMDRHGSLKKSLRLATDALGQGSSLLIFPEGTRSRDGGMTSFKPAIGYLCLNARVDVLPMFLGGTHEALPVGSFLPKQRQLDVRIGAPIRADAMEIATKGWPRAAAYRYVSEQVENAVRALAGLPPRVAEERPLTEEETATGDVRLLESGDAT